MSCKTCVYNLQSGDMEPCKYCHPTNDKYTPYPSDNCRIIIMPICENNYDGLKVKYRVYKTKNGEAVENCFVLRPDKDNAAKEALKTYARVTDNKLLAEDILGWLGNIV